MFKNFFLKRGLKRGIVFGEGLIYIEIYEGKCFKKMIKKRSEKSGGLWWGIDLCGNVWRKIFWKKSGQKKEIVISEGFINMETFNKKKIKKKKRRERKKEVLNEGWSQMRVIFHQKFLWSNSLWWKCQPPWWLVTKWWRVSFWIFNAQSDTTVISGQNKFHHVASPIHCTWQTIFCLKRVGKKWSWMNQVGRNLKRQILCN